MSLLSLHVDRDKKMSLNTSQAVSTGGREREKEKESLVVSKRLN